MIKAVLQSIPTYAMSIFLAPIGVLKEIQTKLSRGWWSGKERGKFWSMLSWRTLCQPKGMGGIGLRNMRLFNIALLGRQVWRLINNKESLYFKVLSSKYFPDGNIFNAKKVNRASFTWSSIAAAVDLLKNSFGWQIGNDEPIKIRKDNWGLEGLNGSTIIPNMLSSGDVSVKNLWKEHDRSWNVEKIASIRSDFNESCPRCGVNAESLIHALRDCTISRKVLTIGGWDLNSNEKQYDRCIDWMEE
ncbi:reverse transcriptase-like protein [Gossypium australe]|uniref:Reverse transcriptase-like protein n=1 Tax=Gossypium australe TaxID=47621 RepID=A0A5B6W9X3_9ROSI|nr:reverse transcriptase-like protein [Gossypium australe]